MSRVLGDLDDMIARVRRRAEQRALATEASSRAEVRRIGEDAQQRAREARETIRAEGRRNAAQAKRRRLAAAELARRRQALEAREARIEQAFEAAQAMLEEHTHQETYAETLGRLARDGARRLNGERVVVRLDPDAHERFGSEDVASWAEERGPALQRAAEPLKEGHGLVVHAGRASVDATFANRLALARTRLRDEVDALLSEAESHRGADEGASQ